MSRKSDVQNELVALIQALLILFVTAEAFLSGWEHRREVKESLATADTALPAAASTKPAAETEPEAEAMAAPVAESNPTVVSAKPTVETESTASAPLSKSGKEEA